jgi:biotin operon repressor
MGWIKSLLGIKKLEKEVDGLEKDVGKLKKADAKGEEMKKKILGILKGEMSTKEIARKLKIGRTWISKLINQLEREGKVKESRRRGREILYVKK